MSELLNPVRVVTFTIVNGKNGDEWFSRKVADMLRWYADNVDVTEIDSGQFKNIRRGDMEMTVAAFAYEAEPRKDVDPAVKKSGVWVGVLPSVYTSIQDA